MFCFLSRVKLVMPAIGAAGLTVIALLLSLSYFREPARKEQALRAFQDLGSSAKAGGPGLLAILEKSHPQEYVVAALAAFRRAAGHNITKRCPSRGVNYPGPSDTDDELNLLIYSFTSGKLPRQCSETLSHEQNFVANFVG